MATYKEIKGVTIQTLDSDPVEDKGTFSTGGDLNSGRSLAAAGDKTAGLGFGGYDGPPNARIDLTEKYDGTSWSEVNELNAGRYGMVGFGTQTAAIGAGGYASPPTPTPHRTQDVESWNGTNWTEVAELNSDMRSGTGFGTATAGYVIGGVRGGSTSDAVESWNGSSWTETTEINTARAGAAGAGITTAGLIFGGTTAAPAITGITESWNGSAWTETSDMPTAADSVFGGGTSTLAAAAGGSVPSKITTLQLWDGSNWTTNPTGLAGQRSSGGTNSSPTQGNLLVTGGTGPGPTNYNPTATEELSFPPPTATILKEGMAFLSGGTSLKVFGTDVGVATATWASGANLSNARAMNAGIGSTNAALSLGGNAFGGPYPVTVEQYDGSSWTEIAEFNTGRAYLAGMGTITSGLVCNGVDTAPPVFNTGKTEEWNGSSWTEKNDLGTARYRASLVGYSATAGLCFGGFNLSEPYPPPASDFAGNESWDGTSWTEVSDLNTARGCSAGAGIQTAALCMGGYAPPTGTPKGVAVEQWDGTSWTEIAETSTNKRGRGGSGAVSRAIVFGGQTSPQNLTEMWNGSSWSEIADLSAGRYLAGSGSLGAVASFQSNGEEPGDSVKFEEFEADAALSTVTVS
jgi:hypothetical protein